VVVEILDAQGRPIVSFAGTPKAADAPAGRGAGRGGDAEDEGGGGRRGAGPARVGTAAGMNRFVWDMRYADARDFPGMILWAANTRGPLAPPGRYQVRLTANATTKTHEFSILRNTRVATVTDADLQAQFALARQINERVSAANGAVVRIRGLKEQLAARSTKASDASLTTSMQALIDKLTSVEGEIYQHRNRSNQDPLNYPIRLNNKLAALRGVVEAGDARPTDQAYAVFKELSTRLDKELARLEAVIASDLSAINKRLADQKLDPVTDAPPPRSQPM
jgi:hypothetical protein